MTRDEMKLRSVLLGLATLIMPITGFICFFIKPVAFLGVIIFYAGPVVCLLLYVLSKRKENKIAWVRYTCPHCGLDFEAEPGDIEVKHLVCRRQVLIKDGRAVKE